MSGSRPEGSEYVIATKGSPEAIADLCHCDASRTREISSAIEIMANEGLRILGVAKAYFTVTDLPGEQHDFTFEFLGLVGLADPVRPGVAEAVKECHAAGIRVVMITGDYPGTAANIAGQIGLQNSDQVITGPELDSMDEEQLRDRIRTVNIFARVVPEQKLRIVNAFKGIGEVVAMTGDGVNDAPALKAAHIGIAMGGRGTDVAREASALVLLDDDFSSIVQAVRMGRRIFDNLKKAVAYGPGHAAFAEYRAVCDGGRSRVSRTGAVRSISSGPVPVLGPPPVRYLYLRCCRCHEYSMVRGVKDGASRVNAGHQSTR